VPAEQRDATARSASRLTHSDFERGRTVDIREVVNTEMHTSPPAAKRDAALPAAASEANYEITTHHSLAIVTPVRLKASPST
jgi:hypothetical protein